MLIAEELPRPQSNARLPNCPANKQLFRSAMLAQLIGGASFFVFAAVGNNVIFAIILSALDKLYCSFDSLLLTDQLSTLYRFRREIVVHLDEFPAD